MIHYRFLLDKDLTLLFLSPVSLSSTQILIYWLFSHGLSPVLCGGNDARPGGSWFKSLSEFPSQCHDAASVTRGTQFLRP